MASATMAALLLVVAACGVPVESHPPATGIVFEPDCVNLSRSPGSYVWLKHNAKAPWEWGEEHPRITNIYPFTSGKLKISMNTGGYWYWEDNNDVGETHVWVEDARGWRGELKIVLLDMSCKEYYKGEVTP